MTTTNYQTGDQSSNELKEQIKQDVGNKAREASRHLADKGKEQADALSGKTADALEDVEAAMDAEAEEFERRGWGNLSEYIREMADGIGSLSDDLRHKSVDELVRSASGLAQRNTGLFVLGSVAIGFGLSRLAKAAPRAQDEQNRRAADPAGNPDYDYPAGESRAAFDSYSGDGYRPYESH